MLNHPDMGGTAERMKQINIEYQSLKKRLTSPKEPESGFEINELVRINNSLGRISHIGEHIIIVSSEKTNKKAIFSRESGDCLNHPTYKLHKIKAKHYAGQ